jgi:tRNA (cmo5U34)-methyltransferase
MLSTLFTYLPDGFSPGAILELGCGTGNLTRLIHQRFPESHLSAVDISGECIDQCRQRLPHADIEYVNADFRDLDFPQGSFDLTMSSIAIHHLEDRDKEELFARTARWLTPGGVFTFCDQFRGETDSLYERHLEAWRAFAFTQGASDDEWNMWMGHQTEHDHHASLVRHLDMLRGAGYIAVDCTWRYLLWVAVYAAKA